MSGSDIKMERETPIGNGSAKKRKLAMGFGQSPLINLELETKSFEIQRLKEMVQGLHERVYELESAAADDDGDKENEEMEVKMDQKIDGSKNVEEVEKLELAVKEKESKIKELEAELEAKKKDEEKLRSEIEFLKAQNSNMDMEIKRLKDRIPSSNNDTGSKSITVEDIHVGRNINFDVLIPENTLFVGKLEAGEINSWKLSSTETSEPFTMDIADIFNRTKFRMFVHGTLICNDQENPNRINEVLQPVSSWTLDTLNLGFQTLDEYDYKKLATDKIRICKLQNISVKKTGGTFLRADELLAAIPNVEEFEYCFKRYNHEPLQNLLEHFAKLPRFKNLKKFKFCNVTNKFDLETFGKFITNHPTTSFIVQYHPLGEKAQFKIQETAKKLAETSKVSVEFTDK